MTTALQQDEAADASAATTVGERGRTEITERALRIIAAHVAGEVPDVTGPAKRLLGVERGRDTAREWPDVSAEVYGDRAIIRLKVTVAYPRPVRETTRRLRDHVTARTTELTGLDVRQVDIEVARLVEPAVAPRRVE